MGESGLSTPTELGATGEQSTAREAKNTESGREITSGGEPSSFERFVPLLSELPAAKDQKRLL